MNGFELRGRDAHAPAAVEQFVLNVRAMFDSIGLLEDWVAAITAETARLRGFKEGAEVPLLDYLDALVQYPADKANAFERLCVYFQSPVKPQT